MKRKYNSSETKVLDERQTQAIGNAESLITLITFIYLLIEITYKYVSTKNILNCSWEIVLLIIIGIVFVVATRKQKELNLPKSIFGKTLPTEKSKSAHKKRLISYMVTSMFFACAFTVLTVIFSLLGVDEVYSIYLIGLQFVGLFIIFFILDYILGEHQCIKYNH